MKTLINSMKPSTAALNIIAIATSFLLRAGAAWGEQGYPIPGRDIVIEGDPGSSLVASGKTDAKGNATFSKL
jgi:hypothetical protein